METGRAKRKGNVDHDPKAVGRAFPNRWGVLGNIEHTGAFTIGSRHTVAPRVHLYDEWENKDDVRGTN